MFWERFINLGLLCRALGFGRILRVWGAPKGGQPHGGWDGQWMGFFCHTLVGREVVICASHASAPRASHFVRFPLCGQ